MDLASRDLGKRIIKIGIGLVVSVTVLAVLFFAVLMIARISVFAISGRSMEPTLHHGDSIVLKQSDYVSRGQIVVFKKPNSWDSYVERDTNLIKRITAIPGDTLAFDGKVFMVNGETVYELDQDNYECVKGQTGYEHTLTGEELFVMGDNASHSLDSRRIFCDGNMDKIFIPKYDVVDYGTIIFRF